MNAPRDLRAAPFAAQLGLAAPVAAEPVLTERAPKPGVGKNPGSATRSSGGRSAVAPEAPAAGESKPAPAAGAATSRRGAFPYFAVDSTGQLVIDLERLTEPLLLTAAEHHALRVFLNLNHGVAK